MSRLCYPLFSPLQVAQHVSGNYVPIFRSWRLSSVSPRVGIVPWLQEVCQNRLAGSVSIVEFSEHLNGHYWATCKGENKG